MKQGWKLITLGDACEKGSSNVSQNQLNDDAGDYPIYGASGFIKNVSFYHNEKPYLSIVKDGSGVGRVTRMDAYTSVIGTLQYILPKEGIDLNYLYYSLISVDFKKYAAGAAIPHIYFKDYKNEPFLWMPLPEQKRIVAILDEAFAAIAKAKANAEQNLKNAKELFESYLQGVFEKKGDGWEEKTLGEIADVEYGYTDKSTEEGDYRYIRITDIDKNGELILEDKKYIKHSEEAEGFLIRDNDLLMARTGATFAKVLLFNGDEPSVFASYLIRIKFKEKIENALYWHFTKTKNYWEQANSLQSGAAQPHFNGAAVKQVVFAYPKSVKEQKALIEKFEMLSTETKKLEAIYQQKIKDLEELKKSILQKAFAGELRSPEGAEYTNDVATPIAKKKTITSPERA
jgi:type I restriction enzyme S subunit